MIRTTECLIIGTIVVLALYDLVAYMRSGEDATISKVVFHASLRYPIIPFAVGVLCGHFFWPLNRQ